MIWLHLIYYLLTLYLSYMAFIHQHGFCSTISVNYIIWGFVEIDVCRKKGNK